MKRVGNLMPQIADVDNLLLAYSKARRGKQDKIEVIEYSANLFENILSLRERMLNETLSVGNYHYFEIYDPKRRQICAASFEERVVHHAIMNVCKERFDRHLIFDTYATRENKGIYAAIERAQRAVCKYPYVAKLDVRKYFDSINHQILKSKLRRIFKDDKLLRLLDAIIDSYETKPSTGIPIGNLTSQYFANYYLSDLDHYITEELRVPVYVRYMDDMLIFAPTREKLVNVVEVIKSYVEKNLSLELKPSQIVNVNGGVSFLGYSLAPYRINLNGRSKKRFVSKLRIYDLLLENGEWSEEVYVQHIRPLLAFVEKANTLSLRRDVGRRFAVGG